MLNETPQSSSRCCEGARMARLSPGVAASLVAEVTIRRLATAARQLAETENRVIVCDRRCRYARVHADLWDWRCIYVKVQRCEQLTDNRHILDSPPICSRRHDTARRWGARWWRAARRGGAEGAVFGEVVGERQLSGRVSEARGETGTVTALCCHGIPPLYAGWRSGCRVAPRRNWRVIGLFRDTAKAG